MKLESIREIIEKKFYIYEKKTRQTQVNYNLISNITIELINHSEPKIIEV